MTNLKLSLHPKPLQMLSQARQSIVSKMDTEYVLLTFIIAYALIVRFTGIAEGLPYLHHYDEPFIASTSLEMLRNGDFNPHWFFYPGFMMYACFAVDTLHYLYLIGQPESAASYITNLNEIVIGADTGWNWTISHPSFYLWNRWLVAIFGTITVYFTYLVGKEVAHNKYVGLISAALMSVSPIMIHHSRFITPNMVGVLFVLAVVYYSMLFNSTHKLLHLFYSLIFVGLAIAAKYNYAICMAIPMISCLLQAKKLKVNFQLAIVGCVLIPVLVFFVFNPYALVDFKVFLNNMGRMVRHYKVEGHNTHSIQPGLTHIIFQLGEFRKEIGLLLLLLSGLGIILSFKFKYGWFMFLLPFMYFLYMSRQRVDFHRNFLVLYPFIFIWLSITFYRAADFLKIIIAKFESKISSAALRNLLPRFPYLAIAVVILLTGRSEMAKALDLAHHRETRSQVIDTLNELLKGEGSGAKVAFAKELQMHAQDLRRLHAKYEVINHLKFKSQARKYKYFVSGPYNTPSSHAPKQDSVFNAAYPDREIISRINGRGPIRLRVFSADPTIFIYKGGAIGDIDYDKLTAASFDRLIEITKDDADTQAGTYKGTSGQFTTQPIQFAAGKYLLHVVSKGNLVVNETAKLKISLGDNELGILHTETSFAANDFTFQVDSTSRVPLKIDFLNDYWNNKTKEDRNFYIKDIELRKVK